jgi:hypothetical protein
MDALNLNCSLKRMLCDGGIHAAVINSKRKKDGLTFEKNSSISCF